MRRKDSFCGKFASCSAHASTSQTPEQIQQYHIMFSHSRYLTVAPKITLSTMCCSIKLFVDSVAENFLIQREINRCLNRLATSLTDACLLKTDYLHSIERKPEFSANSIDDCINTLQIISGHTSHLISLESRELCCWLVEET